MTRNKKHQCRCANWILCHGVVQCVFIDPAHYDRLVDARLSAAREAVFPGFTRDNLNLRYPSDEILQKSAGFISHVHLGESCSWKMEKKGRPCQNKP